MAYTKPPDAGKSISYSFGYYKCIINNLLNALFSKWSSQALVLISIWQRNVKVPLIYNWCNKFTSRLIDLFIRCDWLDLLVVGGLINSKGYNDCLGPWVVNGLVTKYRGSTATVLRSQTVSG